MSARVETAELPKSLRVPVPGPWRVETDWRGAASHRVVNHSGQLVCECQDIATAEWIAAKGPK